MRIIGEAENNVFPMQIRCKHTYGYGKPIDFCGRKLEIEANDIVKHLWFKYPDSSGVDYGVVCPVCGMFVGLDEDKIPNHVKKTAPEVSIRDGKVKVEELSDTFIFEFMQTAHIKATCIGDAVSIFQEKYPACSQHNIKRILHNNQRLAYERSKTTGERIWFEPGCVCGETDCIHDPMCEIAKSCEHQFDMTPDKWVACDYADKNGCRNYDDECK